MIEMTRYGRDKEHEEAIENARKEAKKIHDAETASKSLTDEEIEAMTDDLGPDDLERAIASRTPGMQALLNAEPED